MGKETYFLTAKKTFDKGRIQVCIFFSGLSFIEWKDLLEFFNMFFCSVDKQQAERLKSHKRRPEVNRLDSEWA